MRTKLIPGETPAAIDQQILDFVASEGDDNPFPMGEKFVAVANEDGRVYRVLIADGVIEAIRADKFLVGLGCREIPTQRYNSLFQAPSA